MKGVRVSIGGDLTMNSTDPQEMDSEVLFQRGRDGDEDCFKELLLREYGKLHAHIVTKLSGQALGTISPEDVLQETFRKAFVAITQFESDSHKAIYSWLRRIADNMMMDQMRRLRYEVRPKGHGGDAALSSLSFSGLFDPITGDGAPAEDLQRRELIDAFRFALTQLDGDYRTAISLRFLEGMELAEVAREMGRTTASVRALCHRAKKQLYSLLKQSHMSLFESWG